MAWEALKISMPIILFTNRNVRYGNFLPLGKQNIRKIIYSGFAYIELIVDQTYECEINERMCIN